MPRKLIVFPQMFSAANEEDEIFVIGVADNENAFMEAVLEVFDDFSEDEIYIETLRDMYHYNQLCDISGIIEITPDHRFEKLYES